MDHHKHGAHVFTTSIYYGLNVENSPNLSDLWPVDSNFSLLHYDEKYLELITKTGGFWEPVRGITNGGSWVVIHMMEHPPEGWGANGAE